MSEQLTIKMGLLMCLGQLKSCIASAYDLNDHESTASIDLEGHKEMLASRQICKCKFLNDYKWYMKYKFDF